MNALLKIGCCVVIVLVVCFQPGTNVHAQVVKKGVLEDEKGVLMKNEFSFGGDAHTRGFGINVRRGHHITAAKYKMYDFDLVSMRHPKEFTQSSQFQNGDSYVFGKLNSTWILRTGVGYRQTLIAKQEKGGVEIRYNYFGGISWGFAKPIYLQIYNGTEQPQLKEERFDPDRDSPYNIFGKASALTGIGETKIYPGLYVKGSISFEFGDNDESLKMIEAGFVLDAYAKAIPIMALTSNPNIYPCLYLNLIWGKRW